MRSVPSFGVGYRVFSDSPSQGGNRWPLRILAAVVGPDTNSSLALGNMIQAQVDSYILEHSPFYAEWMSTTVCQRCVVVKADLGFKHLGADQLVVLVRLEALK